MTDTLPNSQIEGTPAANPESKAMKLLARVAAQTPASDNPTPKDVVVTKPPMKGETPDLTPDDSYDLGEDAALPADPLTSKEKELTPPTGELDDIDRIIDIKGTSAENMKRLRTKLKSTHQERETFRLENEALKNKVQEYDTGLVVPEQLQTLQNEIEELQKYKQIYNLEASPGYIEAIATPMTETKDTLVALAGDYEAPLEILDQAMALTNKAERNRLLGQYFTDPAAVLEVNTHLNRLQELNQKAAAARNEPSKAMAKLHKQTQDALAERRAQEIEGISAVAKSGWSESLMALREEDHLFLSFKDGDTEHNETIARPILNKASRDYGVVIRALGENGLKQLPQEISGVIARSIQLAHESAILRHQNNQLTEEVITLRTRVGNLNSLNRPGVNGGGNGYSAAPQTGGTAASRSLARAMQK